MHLLAWRPSHPKYPAPRDSDVASAIPEPVTRSVLRSAVPRGRALQAPEAAAAFTLRWKSPAKRVLRATPMILARRRRSQLRSSPVIVARPVARRGPPCQDLVLPSLIAAHHRTAGPNKMME